jgi:hypothetical protein
MLWLHDLENTVQCGILKLNMQQHGCKDRLAVGEGEIVSEGRERQGMTGGRQCCKIRIY